MGARAEAEGAVLGKKSEKAIWQIWKSFGFIYTVEYYSELARVWHVYISNI